ncbi:MAG: DUF58 domain-containing protein [Anaerolineae bacterium]|nr:DUF58 domain-containing protein [Anaerolineae bacterium]
MVKAVVKLTSPVPLIVVVGLFILQVFAPAPAIMFTLVAIGGVMGISYLWARQLAKGVSLHRQRRYGWAQVGDILEERFIMHNDGWVPILWAEIRDLSDLPGYNASRAVGMSARSTLRWTTSGVCERRGIYTLGPIRIYMGDPFGLFRITIYHNYQETFVVYPPIAALPPLVEPQGMARGASRANIRSLDLTTNASSVRQYVPGDALKRIHWRSTARRSFPGHEEIFVKEFDLEPSGDLWILLDMDADVHVGEGPESTEEYAVILAASLANQLLRENHAVGLLTYQKEPIIVPPQKGPHQLWEILRVLAGAYAIAPASLNDLFELFEPLTGRGLSALIITPSADANWIKGLSILLRHGVHLSGLLLDARSFGGEGDVQGVLGALADLRVSAHVISQGFTFERITPKREQRPQFKVLGTGRVIMVSPGESSEWVPVGQKDQTS